MAYDEVSNALRPPSPSQQSGLKALSSIGAVITLVVLTFHGSLGSFFSFDDFSYLARSQRSFVDVVKLFDIVDTHGWYRPTTELFFTVGRWLFGLDPVGYHVLSFSIHLVTIVLVWYLFSELFQHPWLSSYGTLIYCLNSLQYVPTYWLSAVSETLVTFFMVAALAMLVRFQKSRSLIWLFLSYFACLSAFASKENALVLAFVYPVMAFRKEKSDSWRDAVRRSALIAMPVVLVACIYLAIRLSTGILSSQGPYQLEVGWHVLRNVLQGLVWLTNTPQNLSDGVGVVSIVKVSLYAALIVTALSLDHNLGKPVSALQGAVWCLAAMFPVALLHPARLDSYYFQFSLAGFALLVAGCFSILYLSFGKRLKLLFTSIIIIHLITLSVETKHRLESLERIHWVSKRADVARRAFESLRLLDVRVNKKSKILILGSADTESLAAFHYGDLFRTFYSRQDLRTEFLEDLHQLRGATDGDEWVLFYFLPDGRLVEMTAEVKKFLEQSPVDKVGFLALMFQKAGLELLSDLDVAKNLAPHQLIKGWYDFEPTGGETGHRWIGERAEALLKVPWGTRTLSVSGVIPDISKHLGGKVQLTVVLGGVPLSYREITQSGRWELEAPLEFKEESTQLVEIRVHPTFNPHKIDGARDDRDLGVLIKKIAATPPTNEPSRQKEKW
jgi:hypothetical protein